MNRKLLKGAAGIHEVKTKRDRVSQSDIPRYNLEQTLKIPQVIVDDFGCKSAAPYRIAEALALSPTSSYWRMLSGAAMAYGLTDGAYGSDQINLTELGKKTVSPLEEGQDAYARVEAALLPRIAKDFFAKYNRAKFPRDEIAKNVLIDMGVPKDRVGEVFKILKENGEYVGIIRNNKTGQYVAVETDGDMPPKTLAAETEAPEVEHEEILDLPSKKESIEKAPSVDLPQRVFIAHGKNKVIVQQLKDLLTFGKYAPIVAEEHETASVPVPQKVMEEMRSCGASVIHIESEEDLLDKNGNAHKKINENVLVEIGASLALYKEKVVLLVHSGVTLPSNLQGLYRCEYEGDKLDYEATMKLLKIFSDF